MRSSAWRFASNSTSGAALREPGSGATEGTMMETSVARREPAAATGYALDLTEEDRPPMQIAA
ncbi:hypothetical protein FHT00_002730 [Sphingomonas insulae]|uniref:hypothetical protein n=1 Tax=Sphingomonas insulae TaxID=424800 RepID=UPI0013D87784|nr:hypothetical protein [Sphingomonas insulae]NIJ30757.1 hypothetical protein [Sphingomonas insulae]